MSEPPEGGEAEWPEGEEPHDVDDAEWSEDAAGEFAQPRAAGLGMREVPVADFMRTPRWMKALAWVVLIGAAGLVVLAVVLAMKVGVE